MAHDTFATKLLQAIFRGRNGKYVSQVFEIGEAGIYPGFTVRKSANKLYLCKSGEECLGIVDNMPGHNIDAAYTITTDEAEVFEKGFKNVVAAWMVAQSPPTDLEGGELMSLSATDGMLKKYAYADGVEASDSPKDIVGNFCGDVKITGSATNNQIIDIMI